MTTDDRVMAILERANPVPPGELVDVPVDATRYLETALEQRSETMTVTHPTPGRDRPPRRRWSPIAVAASVVAIVVASIAIVLAVRDDDTVVDRPATTVLSTVPETTAPDVVESLPTTIAAAPAPDPTVAQAVVDAFFTAYNAGDTDAVLALLVDDASVTEQYGSGRPDPSAEAGTRDDLVNSFAWNHAQGEIWTDPRCALAQQVPTGTALSCQWDTLDAVVQAVDGDPIGTNALIVVSDGMIVELHRGFGAPDFATLGKPLERWLEAYHPEVDDGTYCCGADSREESERHGALRAQWSQAWGSWLNEWRCESTACSSSREEWAAQYDAQCLALDPVGQPTAELADVLALVPRPVVSSQFGAASDLVRADRELAGGGLTDARIAELQQQRLDAMLELGIDPACHPTVG